MRVTSAVLLKAHISALNLFKKSITAKIQQSFIELIPFISPESKQDIDEKGTLTFYLFNISFQKHGLPTVQAKDKNKYLLLIGNID